jgi:Flp pilus assembly protein TadB
LAFLDELSQLGALFLWAEAASPLEVAGNTVGRLLIVFVFTLDVAGILAIGW